MRIMRIIIISRGKRQVRFIEIERIIMSDGWRYKNSKGSHNHYIHPTKPGKVTILMHSGDLDKTTIKMIMKQAGLKNPNES
jgi:predicted RNA binding protein YcfA (HicA-like mRNA interferase family)